jgi:PAS domain S-box-containing protein
MSTEEVTPVLRVLVAEDEQPLREAICDLIGSEDDLEVVGAAGGAGEAIRIAGETKPDVAVLDVRMPGGGSGAAAGVREVSPATRIVALSAYEDQATVVEMLRAGAVAYLIKGVTPAEVVEAIRRASRGQASFPSELIAGVMDELVKLARERREADEELGRSEQRFRELLEASPDAVLVVAQDGSIVLVNDLATGLFGHSRSELVGKPVEMLLPERFRGEHVGQRSRYAHAPETRPMGLFLDLTAQRKDGTEFQVDIALASIESKDGRLVTAFVRDMSERHSAEQATRQLAAVIGASDDAIVGKSLEGVVLSWNLGAERMYGYTAEEIVGRSMSILVPPDQPDEFPAILERLKRGEEVDQLGTARLRKDGTQIDVLLRTSAVRAANGSIIGASSISRDITQLKAQGKLERDLAERRALLAHLVASGEEERARIALDIHDDSIQAITAAGMRLQILRRKLVDKDQLELLDGLEETIQLAISRLRRLLFELRPPVLDNEGLSAALATYLDESEDDDSVSYRLEDELREQPSSETRTILYRIVQEALTNVRKHAHAREAVVALKEQSGGYLVRVADDGVGFVAQRAAPLPGHLGLASMRERAILAGGWLSVRAEPGQGTVVEVWIPSPAEESAA